MYFVCLAGFACHCLFVNLKHSVRPSSTNRTTTKDKRDYIFNIYEKSWLPFAFIATNSWKIKHAKNMPVLSNSVVQRPSLETNNHSVGQEMLCLLRNLKLLYHFFNSAMSPLRSQMNLVNIFSYYYFKIHCNVVRPSTPRSAKSSRLFRFSH